MENYSRIDLLIERERQRLETLPADPFPESEKGPDAVRARLARSKEDYWYFDRTYFPAEAYQDYAEPADFHRWLVRTGQTPGIHVFHGPRGGAKTVTLKKLAVWLYMTGRLEVGMTYGATLEHAGPLLESIGRILGEHPRIAHDLRSRVHKLDSDRFEISSPKLDHRLFMTAFSLRRSARGTSREFRRPTWAMGDDVQTASSPLGDEANRQVIGRLSELYKTMVPGRSTLVVPGNNFSPDCYIEELLRRRRLGLLEEHWNVQVIPAWSPVHGSYWPARFPAESEEEMRRMFQADDDEDWAGNGQGSPIAPSGRIFTSAHYAEYHSLPLDAWGVAWCDPNLSLKSAGDTTAIGALLWSAETGRYYVQGPHCESYSDHDQLLGDYIHLHGPRARLMGMDGNVSQESTWTNFIKAYCHRHKLPYPRIHFRRYSVDLLSKNTQLAWQQGEILFPPGFRDTDVGKRFTQQIFAFRGKKAGKVDDAPDWMISCFEFLHEMGVARRGVTGPPPLPEIVHDNYFGL